MLRCALLSVVLLSASASEDAPGTYRRLSSDGGGDWTYNLHLPKAYAARPDERLPVLFISDPGGTPNLDQYIPWSERQGVVLVTINESKNGPWLTIHAAQKSVTAAVFMRYRIHEQLRFTVGFSGGAWASAELALKYGDDWAGILFQGNGQNRTEVRGHIACAYITGGVDDLGITSDSDRTRGAGNPVRVVRMPEKGHENMPIGKLVMLLDWMLELQRLSHPFLDKAEKQMFAKRLQDRVAALPAQADLAARIAEAESLLGIEPVAKGPDGGTVAMVWVEASMAQAETIADLVARNRILEALAASERLSQAGLAVRKALAAKQAELRKDKAVKADSDSRAALAEVEEAEAKGPKTKSKLKNLAGDYASIAQRWPATEAGRKAQAAAERLLPLAK